MILFRSLVKDDNLVLRRAENIREWYEIILHLVAESRTKMMQSTESFWRKSKQEDKTKREDWLVASSRAPSVNNNEKYYINELFERPPSVASVDRQVVDSRVYGWIQGCIWRSRTFHLIV